MIAEKQAEKVEFVIGGEDLQQLNRFKKEHKGCLERHGGMTPAQYEYRFVSDGFGILKTVTCCCGKSVTLSSEYDKAFWGDMHKPVFRVYPEEDRTAAILKRLKEIQRRPGMFFGNQGSYRDLRIYLGGISQALCMYNEDIFWSSLDAEAFNEFTALTDEKDYSDKELFDIYLKTVFGVAEKRCPQYLRDKDI